MKTAIKTIINITNTPPSTAIIIILVVVKTSSLEFVELKALLKSFNFC